MFTDEKNNTFYAFNKDIVQQRLLDDTVTLLDNLNDFARIEANENEKQIDTVEDYANDMYNDGECAYEWRDGLSEWQNISASILSGNTEYLYAWLNDLSSLEENQDVSITNALKYLDNYEKEYMGKLSIDELKKSAEEAGFPEYAEEIRTAYGIYPLVKEELDIIDPPKPVNSHSSYDR